MWKGWCWNSEGVVRLLVLPEMCEFTMEWDHTGREVPPLCGTMGLLTASCCY